MTTTPTVPVEVSLEFTPNPNTLKFVVNRTLLPGSPVDFPLAEAAEKSPLAKRLFAIDGVAGVMIGKDFVTVTKGAEGAWDALHRETITAIREHLDKDLPILDADFAPTERPRGGEGEVERTIQRILDEEIRPAVAMDGGDIIFQEYKDRKVYLHLQGSCHGCPSSMMTLRMGIETRLRAAIPEIEEVVAV